MSVTKPYRRTCLPMVKGGWDDDYIQHVKFAKDRSHYIQSFYVLEKDVREIFDYVEPCDQNKDVFSIRIHSLFMRACIEAEANFKAILRENGYTKKDKKGKTKPEKYWTIDDYKKVNQSHFLSDYQICFPTWRTGRKDFTPFLDWNTAGGALRWYQAYNASKHDRHTSFDKATLENLVQAFLGVLVLLTAQFHKHNFYPQDGFLSFAGPGDGLEIGISQYFPIILPSNIPPNSCYDFDWDSIKDEPDPFQNYPYP